MISQKKIPPVGPKNAKIMIVGEAPGRDEELQGEPFVGTSGRLLTNLLLRAGIRRDECYITNVIKIRPKDNRVENLALLGLKPEDFYEELYQEIDQVKPNVIIALGNIALKALTGEQDILKWRGSVLQTHIKRVTYKVIPSLHPAFCLRQWAMTYILTFDLKKARKESTSRVLIRLKRNFIINPSFDTIINYLTNLLHKLEHSKIPISMDIETYTKQPVIRCLGLTTKINKAICIPFVNAYRPIWTKKEEKEIWLYLYKILTHKNALLVGQNFSFEMHQLAPYTMGNMYPWIDTMRAHALIYPEFKHDLGFINSMYTDLPFFKDDGKTSDERIIPFEQLMEYNCKDVVATLESALKMIRELKEMNMWKFYCEFDNPLQRTLWKMEKRGVRIDVPKLATFYERIQKEIDKLQEELENEIGYKLNVKSSKQMIKFLYEDLNLPKKRNRQTGNLSANEEVLTELYKKYPHIKALHLVIEIRRRRTLRDTFLDMNLSEDKRIRTSYGTTETGRLSSKKNLYGIGANLQNIPKRKGKWIREIFIPDEEKVLIKADLSQAEARVVAWLANDPNYKDMFKSGKDIHRLYASLIFNVPYEEINDAQREKAKLLRHAKNYNMGPGQMAKHLGITITEARRLIAEDDKIFPNINGVFYTMVQRCLQRDRTLTTPFGRKRTFFDRWGDQLLREAYAYIPQSTVADYLNKGLIELNLSLPEGADILMQVHDEVVLQCYPDQVEKVAKLLRKHIERELVINNDTLVIPLDIEVGFNWAEVMDLNKWLEGARRKSADDEAKSCLS